LSRLEQRRSRAEARLRPLAFALIEGDAGEFALPDERDTQVLAGLLSRYSRQLTGASQGRIAAYFEERGEVEREMKGLRSGRPWRRATAAYALGGMSSPTAVPTLLRALEDPNSSVRSSAACSLGRLKAPEAVKPLLEALVNGAVPRSLAGWALISIGAAGLPGLGNLVTHPEAAIRAVTIDLVGVLGDPAYTPLLAKRLRDSSAEVRAKAAISLGRLGASEAATELRMALEDRIPYVRAVAAEALGAIGDRRAVDALLGMADHDLQDPAQAAATAVARIDPRALRASAEKPDAGPYVLEASDLVAMRAV
jgi:HEAT repeat protein